MKRRVVSIILSTILSALLMGSTVYATASAEDLVIVGALEQEDDSYDMSEDYQSNIRYLSFTGIVESITDFEFSKDVIWLDEEGNLAEPPESPIQKHVLVTNEDQMVNFVVSEETFHVFGDIVEGAKVTGFYNGNLPTIMIYPPQYKAEVLVVESDLSPSVFVGEFDENFLSLDGQLKLNVSKETEIVDRVGMKFEGELKGKTLVVLYTITTRSLPPQTSPDKIIVLDGQLATDEIEVPVSEMPIIVEDKIIDAPSAYLNKDNIVMIPLRAVVEALGHNIEWDGETQSIVIGDVNLRIGEDKYSNAIKSKVSLGAPPELVNERTFVPIRFFWDIMSLNNAYVFEGAIVINNQEQMN